MRRIALVLALALAAQAGCTNPQTTISDGFSEVEELFGGTRSPNVYVERIRSVHDQKSLTFKADAEDPIETTREAIRGLTTSDYATWRETAFSLQLISQLSTEHPVALVRAEALDALAVMAPWTFDASVETGNWATDDEVIDALGVFQKAAGKDAVVTPESGLEVADAIRIVAAYDFENSPPLPADASNRLLKRGLAARLRHTRAVLLPITGRTLEDYLSDPDVRGAMDRCCVKLSGSLVRLSLTSAALRDSSVTTRETAVRHLGAVRFALGGEVLARVLRSDAEPSVRRRAVLSLREHDLEHGVPPLIDALSDEMATVRGAAARALEAATGESFGDDRRAWSRWWASRKEAPPPAPTEDPATSATR